MTTDVFLILLLIGATAGVLAGFFGIGGGIIIVPSLIALYGYQDFHSSYLVHIAMATSLFTVIFTTLSSGYKHSKNNNVVWKAVLILGITSSLSVFLFSKLAIDAPGELLKKVFSIILVIVALKMFFEKKKYDEGKNENQVISFNIWVCTVLGILSGIISAFSGLAGGVFLIPLMIYVLKFPVKKAIGTSSMAILLTSVSGVMGYVLNKPADFQGGQYFLGMVDTASALPVIIASIPMTQLGVMIHKKADSKLLVKLFAVFIFLISIRMFFF